MASFGKNSAFAYPLGRDELPSSLTNPEFRRISTSPSNIRFANAGESTRRLMGYSDGNFSHVSSTVITAGSMSPSDKAQFSGVIRRLGRGRNNNIPAKVRG